jgi:hypothetical protein
VDTKKHENAPQPTSEQLAETVGNLTTDQIRFIVARQEYGTDKETAEAIGISPETVKGWKYKGVPIDEAVKMMALDGVIVASELRRRNLAKAMAVKVAGLDSNKEQTRQGVATEIIEWEMGKAKQKQEISGPDNGPLTVVFKLRDDSDQGD